MFCRACMNQLTETEAASTLQTCIACRRKIGPTKTVHLSILSDMGADFRRLVDMLSSMGQEGEEWKDDYDH